MIKNEKKSVKVWEKVKWDYIGSINSKDALLNDRIDARTSTFMEKLCFYVIIFKAIDP